MSVVRYDRQQDKDGITPSSNIIAVVIGGGVFPHFSASHPCVVLAFRYTSTVYSIVLPYHEHLAQHTYQQGNESIQAAMETMKQLVVEICIGKKVLFIAFSMGGIFLLHSYPQLSSVIAPDSMYIVIGTGMSVSVEGEALIAAHWRRFFKEQETLLIKIHGDRAAVDTLLAYIIDSCARVDSSLFEYSEEETVTLVTRNSRVWFIHGKNDEPFPLSDLHNKLTQAMAAAKSRNILTRSLTELVTAVQCSHFNYFARENWPSVQSAAEQVISKHWEQAAVQRTAATHIQAAL